MSKAQITTQATNQVTTQENLPTGLWNFSVIRKAAMAISGLILVGFLYGHWSGNRTLLQGEAAFNTHLAWLQANPILHYGVWFIIAIALIAHLSAGPSHWWHNRRARPVRYHKKKNLETTWAARTMMFSGSLLLLFLVVHLLHVGGWLVFDTGGVYRNLQAGFQYWPILMIYILGQIAIAFHLYHGLWSVFQTLGINHSRLNRWRRPIAAIVGLGIAVLNIGLILLNLNIN